MKLSNIKIGKKIVGAFTLIVLTSVIVSGVIFANKTILQSTSDEVIAELNTAIKMDELLQFAEEQQTAMRGLLITGDVDYIDIYRAKVDHFKNASAKLGESRSGDPALVEALGKISGILTEWQTQVAEKQIELVRHPLTIDQARAIEVTGLSADLFAQMFAVADAEKERIAQSVAAAQASLYTANTTMTTAVIAGAVVSLILAAAFGFLLTRGIASPINEMTVAMNRLAGGDKDCAIPALGRGDEVGEMAQALQTFKNAMDEAERLAAEQAELERKAAEEQAKAAEEREKQARKDAEAQAAEAERAERLRQLTDAFEREIGTILQTVSAAAEQLEGTASSMSTSAETSSSQSRVVASASEEASGNVATVSAAAEELSASIEEIGKSVSASTAAVAQANEKADIAGEKISTLTEASTKIGDIIEVIEGIAEKTNLLSLNATIEAQRAGDAGKGFAVVANEVKQLATQTGQATHEVSQQITGIQSASRESAEALEAIRESIKNVTEITTAIAAAIEEQAAATQEIARNVEQAAAGTRNVAENIVSVEKAANDTGASAGEVLTASKDLSLQSVKIKDFVNDFLTNVKTA
ncbi:MAG: CHASE3 domain-containing protein [Rhodospirillales bacterium]|nr:CHASE3 domain-containing protein [Rhodospirillales bacterium]MBO6786151.1 CHASE3 domain-containing protein [Rhodospirillales bacterium]